MNWPFCALVVRVSTSWRLSEGPWRKMMLTGLEVSLVAKVMACACPSVIGLGTFVKVRTADWAAASAAKALIRRVLENILLFGRVLLMVVMLWNVERRIQDGRSGRERV